MNRSYKNTTIAILLACILTMAIGYAVLNTRLNIEGTSKITSNFNIQVTGINEFYKDQLAETADMSFTPTSATFSTNFQAPGDEAIYEIVIENKGTLTGYVEYTLDADGNIDFGGLDNDYVSIEVVNLSYDKLTVDDFYNYSDAPLANIVLAPGDKLYVYVSCYFSYWITEFPEQKTFTTDIKFDFYTKDKFSETTVFGLDFSKTLLEDNPIVTTGTGLYATEGVDDYGDTFTRYVFKSNGEDVVNNYVSIDGKLWRIVYYDEIRGVNSSDTFFLIEDDDAINKTDYGFSDEIDDDGYYNDFESSPLQSDIWNDHIMSSSNELFYEYFDETSTLAAYVPNDGLYFGGYYWSRYLINISDILKTSTLSTCNINNLSTGGCKSWLTTNGNTYLYNKVYSDENTNTGNVAYLKDNKVISVNPTNTTDYGYYKAALQILSRCDFEIYESDIPADGSKSNPYVLITTSGTWCEPAS